MKPIKTKKSYKVQRMHYILFSLCLHLMFTQVQAQIPDPSYTLTYQDNFNADSLNENDWYYRDQDIIYHGGYNQKENVSVETVGGIGYLRIDYNKWDANGDGTDDVVGGGIMSKKTFGYGYYEAKIKFHDSSRGFHQSFWTTGLGKYSSYSNKYGYNEDAKNDLVPWINSALEIDAIELDSDYNNGGGNFHWHQPSFTTPPGAHKSYSSTYIDTNNWITIGFEWKPGLIIYYIDGIERHRVSYSDSRYAAQEVWLTGLANTTSYFGGGGTPEDGASMKVDYFRFYSKPVEGNILGNNSFEANTQSSEVPFNWIQDDGIYNNLYTDESKVVFDGTAYDGSGYLQHDCQTSSDSISTKQRLDYIANGSYKLSAWVKSSGGLSNSKMRIFGHGGTEKNINIPNTSTWTNIIIDSIDVTSNKAIIAFTTQGDDGQWIKVDKVEFSDINFEPAPPQPNELIIDNGDPGYSESGTWFTSGLTGYNNSSTRYAGSAIGPYTQWTPTIPDTTEYEVYIYKIVSSNSDTNAKITVSYNGGTDIQYLDYSTGTSGWIYLGKYNFASGTSGYVRNSLNTSGKYARADAVKFVQPNDLIIDNGETGYSESGTWLTSGLTGYNNSSTRYAGSAIGPFTQWTPTIPDTTEYEVYIYKIVSSNSDTNAKITVTYNGGTDIQYLDYSTGTSGWIYLGKYNFASGTSGYVRNSLNSSGKYARADAVKFVKPISGGSKMAKPTEKLVSQTVAQEPDTSNILRSLAVVPNPVGSEAVVRFSLIKDSNVTITIFDFNGRKVNQLFSGVVKANVVREVSLQRNNMMSGLYIVKLMTDRGHSYEKQIIVE